MSVLIRTEAELGEVDPEVAALIDDEIERQSSTICLIPSENYVSRAVLEAMGSVFTNKYSEGYAAVAITRVSRWSIGLNPWQSSGRSGCSRSSTRTCSRTQALPRTLRSIWRSVSQATR